MTHEEMKNFLEEVIFPRFREGDYDLSEDDISTLMEFADNVNQRMVENKTCAKELYVCVLLLKELIEPDHEQLYDVFFELTNRLLDNYFGINEV